MRPYLLVTGDFVKTGGMDRANHALAAYLARRGGELHLVAYRVAEDLLKHPNVIFHRVKKIGRSYFLSSPLLKRAGLKWARKIGAAHGRVIVNGGNCPWNDVNWVHHVHAADQPPIAGGVVNQAKIRWRRRMFCREERAIIPQARTIITGCERTKRDLVEKLAVPAEKVHAVYYGVDGKLFHPASAEERLATRQRLGWDAQMPVVAFIGALADRRKGFDTLFEAWARLCEEKSWDARLAVVGRGTEAPIWQQRAMDRGVADRMEFMGFVENLPAMLAACDAHVLPSRYEGYSLATQEALCCGIPAFVTQTAGIAERYPPELQELLIPDADNMEDLVSRLKAWRQRMEEYRLKVKPFCEQLRGDSWEKMAAEIVEVIEKES